MEERLVGVVVEVGRDGMEPHDAFSGLDVNETEPVVLLDACPLANTKGSVGVDGDSVPAEHQHSPEASETPGICWGTEWRLIDTSRSDGNELDVGWKVREDVASVVVREGRDGGGGRVRVSLSVSHIVQ